MVALATWGLALAMPACAQDGTKAPVGHQQTISAKPFGLIVEWFNVEYERKLTNTATLGVSASTTAWGDVDLTNGSLFMRYYPQGERLPDFCSWTDRSRTRVSCGRGCDGSRGRV